MLAKSVDLRLDDWSVSWGFYPTKTNAPGPRHQVFLVRWRLLLVWCLSRITLGFRIYHCFLNRWYKSQEKLYTMVSPTTTKIQDFNVQRFPKEYMNLPTPGPPHDPRRNIDPPETSSRCWRWTSNKREAGGRAFGGMGRIHPNAMRCYIHMGRIVTV